MDTEEDPQSMDDTTRDELPSDRIDAILKMLDSHALPYERFDHPAVHTCDDVKQLAMDISGAETKNLFLCNAKGSRYFLVSVHPQKRVDLKGLGRLVGTSGLRMASEERLVECLGVERGAVTLLGVVNDPFGLVEVVIDKDLWREPALQCHPLVTTSTLVLGHDALATFLDLTDHHPRLVKVPAR